jgi:hypothetical protein
LNFPLHSLRLAALLLIVIAGHAADAPPQDWTVGLARARITPKEHLWMGGFAARTRPAEGTLDDLWIKALVLESPDGGSALLITADLLGTPKWLYDRLCAELERRYGLDRSRIRIANSHTHSGPVLKDALPDIYPLDDAQRTRIAAYSAELERVFLDTVAQAYTNRQPARLAAGAGRATFALNRRTNREGDLPDLRRRGLSPNGPSDFRVPILTVRSPGGPLRAIVFGYAAHTSALTDNYCWSADYAGVAQRTLESRFPGATALFWQGCGSDQSAAPRGTVDLCRQRGEDLAAAVQTALDQPMRPLEARCRTAFEFVPLDFGETPSTAQLESLARTNDYRARWASRLLAQARNGRAFAAGYPDYPVQVWSLGTNTLWIALGGEVCVDYALRFQREFGPDTWVTGYANDVMAYIPSRRLWEEGGYQAGAFEVYGLPANRWCPDIESRIAAAIARLAERVRR